MSVAGRPQEKKASMTISSICHSSYFPSIPELIDTSGIDFHQTNIEDEIDIVRDFINISIIGKGSLEGQVTSIGSAEVCN